MLKLLHTADLHLGCECNQLDLDDRRKLARARLQVVEQILALAEQYGVDAVLWAGDIFDTPNCSEDWWKGFAKALTLRKGWTRPVVLLPGNHDPLHEGSIFHRDHPFRHLLPRWVHVVDCDDTSHFELALGPDAVLYAAPCRSTAGAEDLSLSLPARTDGDQRVRVGLIHGSTFDLAGYQTNFPIAQDAPQKRGLDYLAVGDTHGFRVIPENAVAPIVYPGTPEPTGFGETGAGSVVLVTLKRPGTRPVLVQEHVARWTWRDETVTSLEALRRLASEDLSSTVLRLHLDFTVSVGQEKEVDAITSLLKGNLATSGRAGAFILDRSRLRLQLGPVEEVMKDAPETLAAVAAKLAQEAPHSDEANRALQLLYRLVAEVAQ
jgi:DNA repair exonuclease SbcCD nuclease subunit